MSPVYEEGDFVVTLARPSYKYGDDIVFTDPNYGKMIKTISYRSIDGWFVEGSNQHSLCSDDFGTVSKEQIIGKVLFHIN